MKNASKLACILGCSLLAGVLAMVFMNVTNGQLVDMRNLASSHIARLKGLYLGDLGQVDNFAWMSASDKKLNILNGMVVYSGNTPGVQGDAELVTIGGGDENKIEARQSGIVGGYSNNIGLNGMVNNSAIGGGGENIVYGSNAVIAGGYGNKVGTGGVVIGGSENEATIRSDGTIIFGGQSNRSLGKNNLLFGKYALGWKDSQFVWNDGVSSDSKFSQESSAYVGATNGMLIGTYENKDGVNIVVNGAMQLGDTSNESAYPGEITITSSNGCFYTYDGGYWHVLGEDSATKCTDNGKHIAKTCNFGNVVLQEGDKVLAYSTSYSNNCWENMAYVYCKEGQLLTRQGSADYIFPYCYDQGGGSGNRMLYECEGDIPDMDDIEISGMAPIRTGVNYFYVNPGNLYDMDEDACAFSCKATKEGGLLFQYSDIRHGYYTGENMWIDTPASGSGSWEGSCHYGTPFYHCYWGLGVSNTGVVINPGPTPTENMLYHYSTDVDEYGSAFPCTYTCGSGYVNYGVYSGCVETGSVTEMVTVNFVTNGGSSVAAQVVTKGSKISAPTTTHTRGTVEGWYTDQGLTKKFDFANTAIYSDITLYAKWNCKKDYYKLDGSEDVNMKCFTWEDITVASNTNSYTLMDRNLGAMTNNINSSNSYGYYYRWGNNYGFSADSIAFDTAEISPNGWATNSKGPCPDGYHVPSGDEWEAIKSTWCVSQGYGLTCSNPIDGQGFAESLKLPLAGYRSRWLSGVFNLGRYGYYRSASLNSTNSAYYLLFNLTNPFTSHHSSYQAYGFSVRCLKNDGEYVTVTFDSNGGSNVESQSIAKGGKAKEPTDPIKTCNTFGGWYSDSGLTKSYDFNTAVNNNITLYAKWNAKSNCVELEGDDPEKDVFSWGEIQVGKYIVMDRNLGAQEQFNGEWSNINNKSVGYYYQWGNNYGFSLGSSAKIINNQVTVPSVNIPSKYSSSNWNSYRPWTTQMNLWGSDNDTVSARKGPCPDSNGWHIPTFEEWKDIYREWYKMPNKSSGAEGIAFAKDLSMPPIGYLRGLEKSSFGGMGYYSSTTSMSSTNKHFMLFDQNEVRPHNGEYRSDGFPVRCVRYAPGCTHTITFSSNGGTSVSALSVACGAKGTKPDDPTKTNYIFNGWYTDSELKSAYSWDNVVHKDITLYAKWASNNNKCTVTFNSNGGSSVDTQTINCGAKGTKPTDPTKSCNTFGGWYSDQGLTKSYDFNTAVNNSITLYAKWNRTQQENTVTFNSNGGSNVASQTIKCGNKASKPSDPTKTEQCYNNTFGGWYSDSGLTKSYDFNTAVNNNTILYAKWNRTQQEKTVTFNSNGGSNVASQTIKCGNKVLKPTPPTKSCNTFDDWYSDSGLTSVYNFNTAVNNNITLYAKRTPNNYYIVYSCDGGNGNPGTQTVTYGQGGNVYGKVCSKQGYNFLGWSTNDGASVATWVPGAAMDGELTNGCTKKNLIAVYEKVTEQCMVTFNSNGGSSVDTQTIECGNKVSKPTDPTKTEQCYDNTFGGWYSDQGLTKKYDFNTAVNNNTILYAKWNRTQQEKTVTFNSNGGSAVASQTIKCGSKAKKPQAPIINDYILFDGWCSDSGLTNSYDFDAAVTDNIVLYAKWGDIKIGDNLIMNKNLGATEIFNGDYDNPNEASYGNLYQWGNNYGFPNLGGSVSTVMHAVDASNYGPGNYYSRSLFAYGVDSWDSSYNKNLWGGVTDTNESKKGPCPEGYHVPSGAEWLGVYESWCSDHSSDCEGSKKGFAFIKALRLPAAGETMYINPRAGVDNSDRGSRGYYWSSTAKGGSKGLFGDNVYFIIGYGFNEQGAAGKNITGRSVRCFKKAKAVEKVTVTFDTDGGSTITSQTITKGTNLTKPSNPTSDAGNFVAWYSDQSLTTAFDFSKPVSTNITLYAKWECKKGYERLKGGGGVNQKCVKVQDIKIGKYTIMDRNLGAASNDITSSSSYGYYYQWGNNYGFYDAKNMKKSSTRVNASQYGPRTSIGYYSSDTYITTDSKPYNWDSSNNNGLWGGGSSNYLARKGPCPTGYHIPYKDEWKNIYDAWCKANSSDCKATNAPIKFSQALKLPFGGFININGSWLERTSRGNYWTASTESDGIVYDLFFNKEQIQTMRKFNQRSSASTLRCFKDS